MIELKNITNESLLNMNYREIWGLVSGLKLELKARRTLTKAYSEEIEELKAKNVIKSDTIESQAAEIEKIEFCLGGALADIEKLKDSIRALESEQKDYEKTTMRLRKENEDQAATIEEILQEAINFTELFAKNLHPESEEIIELLSFHDKLTSRLPRVKKCQQ